MTTDARTAATAHDEDAATVSLSAAGTELLRYHYRPGLPAAECPMPYAHPLRTLSGGTVTGNRPHDHRWHKGLSMTASHLSGQNFWGGGTYTPGAPGYGYLDLPNVGRMDHVRFTAPDSGHGFGEELAWHTADGEHWITEHRKLAVRDVDPDGGSWTLEFTSELHNVRASTLEFGSPTVFGRELAGYCGFFWRGPRSFTGGRVLLSDGTEGEAVMGRPGQWLAFTGRFDGRDGAATLVFTAAPDHPGHPPHWFVRSEPYPVVNPSLAFYDALPLAAGERLRLAYRLVVADGEWDARRIAAHLADHPW
ncbi:PmoA family protein [Streptomyces sp. TRM 70351]|uniref:DUF6807 domain-containing protein n=1 Tax=Streptomyces sp. TRM 70351 TaxID=3116552 RepID=UPI002E7C2BD9|nr:PmoA family protein [Streptomyces sp. TRM 70351]MEE1927424.1 PmoA family protein [Streptomyces sp. TRM 70351]